MAGNFCFLRFTNSNICKLFHFQKVTSCPTSKFSYYRFYATAGSEKSANVNNNVKAPHAPHFRTRMQGKTKNEIVENIQKFQSVYHPAEHVKPKKSETVDYRLPHNIWSQDDVTHIEITHIPPKGFIDHWAYFSVRCLRFGFDLFSGYSFGKMTESKWLIRIIFLETVAGVPGMVGAMVRHLNSLRKLKRDHGWIHTLLEDAENERMHLMTAMHLYNPGFLFRALLVGAQGIFTNLFFLCYLCSSRFCHRFVGYLEEEAVKTYSSCLGDIDKDGGCLNSWRTRQAPATAISYWQLGEKATMRDMILAIRADEAHHRLVNHTLASIGKEEDNPFPPGH